MIGVDTNVLVRHLTQDDGAQAARASKFIERTLTPAAPGFISIVTVMETVWVLERAYRFAAAEIAAAVEGVLAADTLIVEREEQVFEAASAMVESGAYCADALVASLCHRAGCARVMTFDRKTARLPGFELL